MAEFDADSPEDKLVQEAEELMRQRRFLDAASRYRDVRRHSPTDLWANLGYVSALECAGNVAEAEQALEEATGSHRSSAPLHRFRHLFFVRREDLRRAALSQAALQLEVVEEGPEDQLADLYFNQGRYHEARAELERLLRDPQMAVRDDHELRASIIARIGACLRQSGEHEPARERLSESLALEPGNHWTLSELAEVERALGNTAQARRRYRESLEVNPSDQWTRGHLAQLESEDGNLGAAIALYEEIIAAEPKAAWAKVELAQALGESDGERARALCEAALDDDPAYPWAHAQLGNLARRAGHLDEARKRFENAAAASPGATWILHEQADICRHLGRLEEAYAHLERAKGLNPYDAVTYGYFADLLRHEGKQAAAVGYLEKAVEFDENYTWAWRELAELRALAGRHDEAERAYRRALALEPEEAINDGLKAFLLRCRGRRDAAMPYLERAVETQSDYLWAWREQIDHHLAAGRPAAAEAAARRGLAALAEAPPLLALLAEALRRQGRRAEAAEVATKAIAAAGDTGTLWAIQAEIAAEEDDLPTAQRCAARAVELDGAPEYHALHARILLALGRDDEADQAITTLLVPPQPILPAFELSAALAERRQQPEVARGWCERGLAAFPHEPRLLLRRARLAMQAASGAEAKAAAVAPLAVLFERAAGERVPWRDLAQLYASAGQGLPARRAAHLQLAAAHAASEEPSASDSARGEQARAWLAVAETELALGNPGDAFQALGQSLARDGAAVPAHILGAVLAEQRGDLASAAAHLEHIDRQLRAGGPAQAGSAHAGLLARQLAALYERQGRLADAEALWRRLVSEPGGAQPAPALHRAEFATFLLRQGRLAEAEPLAGEILPGLLAGRAAQAVETQHLLRDLTLRRASRPGGGRDSLRAACAGLAAHDDQLSTSNRLLLVQLALVCEDHATARHQLDRAVAAEPGNRAVGLLRVRLHLATRDAAAGERLARELWEQARGDQEAAALHAECLAERGSFAAALAVLDDPALPARPLQERGLLAAFIALEAHGVPACLARLGRLAPPDAATPLVRVLAAAWPELWPGLAVQPAGRDDLFSLPAFPQAALRLAAALGAQGRAALAAEQLLLTAETLAGRGEAQAARRLRRAAVPRLLASGARRRALRTAWLARAYPMLLRCLWP